MSNYTWIDQSLNPPLTHRGQLMDADGEVVQRLSRVLAVEVTSGNNLSPLGKHDLEKIGVMYSFIVH